MPLRLSVFAAGSRPIGHTDIDRRVLNELISDKAMGVHDMNVDNENTRKRSTTSEANMEMTSRYNSGINHFLDPALSA